MTSIQKLLLDHHYFYYILIIFINVNYVLIGIHLLLQLTKYNLFEDTEKGSQNLCEDWMQNVKLNNLGECLSVCSNDDQPVPENDVELETLSITNERTGSVRRFVIRNCL